MYTHEVAWHTTSVLSQRHKNKRKECCAKVPDTRCPVEVGKWLVLHMPKSRHVLIASTIGSSWQACEDGDEADSDGHSPFVA